MGRGWNIHSMTWFFTLELTLLSIQFVLFTLLILSCNIAAMLLVISGFDFWLKLWYIVSIGIAISIYHHKQIDQFERNWVIMEDLISILEVMAVILASSIEGFGTSWKVSFGLGLLMSCIFTWLAVQFTLFFESFGYEEYYIEPMPGMSFGLLSYIASALRVLSL